MAHKPLGTSTAKNQLMRATGVASARNEGGSVFLSPDPVEGAAITSQILDNPDQLATIIAEHSSVSLATRVLGGERTVNTGMLWFSSLGPEDLTVEGLADRAEGTEYPMVRISPADLKALHPSDIGGKFRVSDEARAAGITDIIRDGISLITKGLVDTLDDMVLKALDEATALTPHGVMPVDSWADVQLTGATPTPAGQTPAAALVRAQTELRTKGLLTRGDMLVVNPADDANLRIAYGPQYADLLTGLGMEVAISPRVAADTAYVVGTGGLGGVVSKNGLTAETWRDPAIRSTWAQVYLEPAVYISRPGNIIKLTGTSTVEGA
ncbi:hypothetical protein G6027_17070 [Dietzia sp. SLG310A2-38A2]|uniref:major capsid protein n=1 Tax=Dietzia sp. SLG310A2-38A2 TaxID=1630643 RepID=UPI0015FE0CDD|nr:major capsid protein [Dietzia sp. SLG310A2-38A2]MBB1032554.1 hypothetical protein [Dietzia sp. SLG310A2-38A2]